MFWCLIPSYYGSPFYAFLPGTKIYIMLNIYLLLLAMLFRKMENLFENFVKDFEHVLSICFLFLFCFFFVCVNIWVVWYFYMGCLMIFFFFLNYLFVLFLHRINRTTLLWSTKPGVDRFLPLMCEMQSSMRATAPYRCGAKFPHTPPPPNNRPHHTMNRPNWHHFFTHPFLLSLHF